jgi:hypothetical protein
LLAASWCGLSVAGAYYGLRQVTDRILERGDGGTSSTGSADCDVLMAFAGEV